MPARFHNLSFSLSLCSFGALVSSADAAADPLGLGSAWALHVELSPG